MHSCSYYDGGRDLIRASSPSKGISESKKIETKMSNAVAACQEKTSSSGGLFCAFFSYMGRFELPLRARYCSAKRTTAVQKPNVPSRLPMLNFWRVTGSMITANQSIQKQDKAIPNQTLLQVRFYLAGFPHSKRRGRGTHLLSKLTKNELLKNKKVDLQNGICHTNTGSACLYVSHWSQSHTYKMSCSGQSICVGF